MCSHLRDNLHFFPWISFCSSVAKLSLFNLARGQVFSLLTVGFAVNLFGLACQSPPVGRAGGPNDCNWLKC